MIDILIFQADPLGPEGISVPSGTPIQNYVPESKTLQVTASAIMPFNTAVFWGLDNAANNTIYNRDSSHYVITSTLISTKSTIITSMMNDVFLLRTVDDRSTTPLTTRSLIPMQTLSLDQVSKDGIIVA